MFFVRRGGGSYEGYLDDISIFSGGEFLKSETVQVCTTTMPTDSPTNFPTDAPTDSPTTVFSTTPTTSSPTKIPTTFSPTEASVEQVESCDDSEDFRYKKKNGKTCSWLMNKRKKKRRKLCKKKQRDKDGNKIRVYDWCPTSCGTICKGSCKSSTCNK